jgi:mRNA interferase RelE/StbE
MRVRYQKVFLKELASIPPNPRARIERFVFEELPQGESLEQSGKAERMKGYPGFYKARFGDYRVGMRIEGDAVVMEHALHRKDIYRKFPT